MPIAFVSPDDKAHNEHEYQERDHAVVTFWPSGVSPYFWRNSSTLKKARSQFLSVVFNPAAGQVQVPRV